MKILEKIRKNNWLNNDNKKRSWLLSKFIITITIVSIIGLMVLIPKDTCNKDVSLSYSTKDSNLFDFKSINEDIKQKLSTKKIKCFDVYKTNDWVNDLIKIYSKDKDIDKIKWIMLNYQKKLTLAMEKKLPEINLVPYHNDVLNFLIPILEWYSISYNPKQDFSINSKLWIPIVNSIFSVYNWESNYTIAIGSWFSGFFVKPSEINSFSDYMSSYYDNFIKKNGQIVKVWSYNNR